MSFRTLLLFVTVLTGVLSATLLGEVRPSAAQTLPTIRAFSCGPTPVLVGQEITCAADVDGPVQTVQFNWDEANANIETTTTPVVGVYGKNFVFLQPGWYVIGIYVCSVATDEPIDLNTPGCAVGNTFFTVAQSGSCQQWNMTGTWQTAQGNDYHPTFAFMQSGTSVSGTATLPPGEAERAGFTSTTGVIAAGGSLTGDQLDITVVWSGRTGTVQGHYTATVSVDAATGQGTLVGDAGGTSWTGTGPLACAVP